MSACGGDEVFLAKELHAVGERLQQPFGTGAVRPHPVLHRREHFTLVPGHVGHADEQDVHEDERHNERQPEWLIHTIAFLPMRRPNPTQKPGGGGAAGMIRNSTRCLWERPDRVRVTSRALGSAADQKIG